MTPAGFLFEDKTACGHRMPQRYRFYGEGTVVEDNLGATGIDVVEDDGKWQMLAEISEKRECERLEVLMGVDVHILRTAEHSECGEQTEQSEAVVAVEVGDEDIVQAGGVYAETADSVLRPFTAVNKKKFVTHLKDL